MDDLGIRNYILENNPGIAYSLLPSSAIAAVGKWRSVSGGVQIVKILNNFETGNCFLHKAGRNGYRQGHQTDILTAAQNSC